MSVSAISRSFPMPTTEAKPLTANLTSPALLTVFMICLLVPLYFNIANVRFTPTRLYLMLLIVPLTVQLLSGKVGKVKGIDICFMLFMVWMLVVMVYHYGASRIPLTVAMTAEMFGGYLVGRVMIRNEADFRYFFKLFTTLLVLLLPFVLVELWTNRNLVQEITRLIGPSFFKGDSSYGRMGLNRVMAGFEHPILYGLFCSFGFACVYYIHRDRRFRALLAAAFIGFMTFASLSSAPLLAVAIQAGLVLWARFTGERWWLLIILMSIAYVTVDSLSNRTPITILINYVTFDPNTAWTRVNTWTFGSAEVLRHPIMGIGLEDWERPYWLTGSVDNFWLLTAMRYGFPGVGLLLLGASLGIAAVVKVKTLPAHIHQYRTGYLIALASLYFSLVTVHVWGNSSAFTMMFIGMGVWFSNVVPQDLPDGAPKAVSGRGHASPRHDRGTLEPNSVTASDAGRTAFSRFPQAHQRRNPPLSDVKNG